MTNQFIAQIIVLGMFVIIFAGAFIVIFKSVWNKYGYRLGLYDLEVEYDDDNHKEV